ncbi:hypothetical protein, partial [Herminiimonas contaminans]
MEAGDAPVEEEALMGAKKILIHATTRYPIVSAYEFEFLMKEDVIRKRMKGCTLYLILQRPLTYMTNLRESHDGIHFDIVDDHQAPLRCHLPLIENKIAAADELMTLDVLFLKRTPDTKSPFNDVAGFKLWRENGSFVVWYSPHKFLYEVLVGSLHANIEGDPCRFLDFRVHYIGQTISQRVWKRLTGHHKLQKVLTMEGPVNEKRGNRVAWEVSLVMLSIDDFESLSDFLCAEGHEMIPKGKHHDYIDEHSKKAQETESPQTFFRR